MFMITKLAIFLLVLGNLGLRITEQSDHLKAGDMLNDSNPSLCSAGDVYCLSFATPNDPTYLSIYNRGTEATVWNAPRTEPLLNQSSAALSLDHFGALKMTGQGGEPIILYPPSSAQPQPVDTVATLLDTGNFVLEELHPNGVRSLLWQSFDHPTDTLLPGMRLGFNNKTGKTRSLVSDISRLSVIPGGFTLEWEHTRRQLIIRRRGQDYWASGELINGMFKDISKEVQRFYNYTIISNQDEEYFTFATTRKDEDARWTLSYDGLITDSRGNEIANAGKCYGYNDDGGCQLRDQPPCRHVGEMFDEMDVTVRDQGITYDVDGNEGLGLSDCKATCWSNCGCVGFTSYHDNEAGCVFYYENSQKNVPEGPVLTISLLVNRTLNTGGPWPAPESESAPEPAPMIMPVPSPGSESNASTKKIKWLIAISITTLFIICAPILWLLLKRRKLMLEAEKKRTRMEAAMLDFEASNEYENANELQNDKKKGHDLRLFSYASIMEATNGFSSENKLGEGGFGPVYKGKLQMGKDVAVKRLSRSSGQGVIEFKNELRLISKLQHTNLVQLLGCCIQGDERILIYEYMPNKSLDYFLFDATRSELLDWKKRFSIIESIAQGLLYLHKYSRLRVVHRDLKASNILLDENMNPKISDFGLAKIITQESEGNTQRIVGTYGYMPPEYAMEGVFSIKSDVYSFGILMLEIVSGRRNNSFYGDNYPLNLVGHAWELWKQGAALALVDPAMKDSIVQDQVLRCIHVGLLCAEERAVDRPTMTDISSMLANESAKLPLLKRPAFCFLDRANEANESLVQPKIDSSNGLSISDLSAR